MMKNRNAAKAEVIFLAELKSAPLIWAVGLSVLFVLAQGLPAFRFFSDPLHYLPLHLLLEVMAVTVACMVFSLAWGVRSLEDNPTRVLLGTGFLAVGLIDVAHALSFLGMPDFITPNGTGKGIFFWLAARYVAALTMLGVAFLALPRWSSATCNLAAVGALALAALVWWIGIFHLDWLPPFFVVGQGLTPLKIGAEYLVSMFYAIAALGFFLRYRSSGERKWLWLVAAAWIQGVAELYFTLYANVSDMFNLLGHLYKAVAYVLIYQGIFVNGVLAPYRALDYERTWLQALLENIPDPVWLKDGNGVYVARNRAFEEMIVKERQEVIGRNDYEIFDRETAEHFRQNDQLALSGGKQVRIQERLRTAGGQEMILESTKAPMSLHSGEVIGVLGVARDITEKIATERELGIYRAQLETQVAERTQALAAALAEAEAANRAKSVFLSNMNHELRTPLNAVIGFSRLMAKSENLNATEKNNLEIINRSGNHLLTLINDVLELSKIEAGHISISEASADLGELAREIFAMLKPRAEQGGLLLTLEMNELSAIVRVDTVKLRQILINLLGNAIKFTRHGSVSLRIGSRPAGGGMADIDFAVRDTGIGIAPEDQQRIFEPFAQLVTHATSAGTGLGLSITRQYLRMLGSSLLLDSTPGVGSCFSFTLRLPVIETKRLSSFAGGAVQGQERGLGIETGGEIEQGRRVLLVDDNADARQLLLQLLEPLGFRIEEARDGSEALKLVERFQPELIIMDWRMPVMDGLEATRRIRALPLSVQPRILMLTASAFEEERQHAFAAGIDGFLRKPLQDEELMHAIERLLDLQIEHLAATRNGEALPAGDEIDAMPGQLREELCLAVEELNPLKIKALLRQLEITHPSLAAMLARLNQEFRYRELWSLLRQEA